MTTHHSKKHSDRPTRADRLAGLSGLVLVGLAATLAAQVFHLPDWAAQAQGQGSQTGGNDAGISPKVKNIFAGAKPQGGAVKGCKADGSMGFKWLDDSKKGGVTQGITTRIKDLVENFEVRVSLDRFAGADDNAKTEQRNIAKGKFVGFAKDLLSLAEGVAIEADMECQDCIDINNWAYLGRISAFGDKKYGVGEQKAGYLVSKSGQAKLEDVTRDGMRAARSRVSRFMELGKTWETADDDQKMRAWSSEVCPARMNLENEADYIACFGLLRARCQTNLFSPQFCTKLMITAELVDQLDRIVGVLNRSRRTDVTMKSLPSDSCQPQDNAGYFKHIPSKHLTQAVEGL